MEPYDGLKYVKLSFMPAGIDLVDGESRTFDGLEEVLKSTYDTSIDNVIESLYSPCSRSQLGTSEQPDSSAPRCSG